MFSTLDDRVQRYLAHTLGVAPEALPTAGVAVRESARPRDEAGHRLSIVRRGQAVVVTGVPRVVEATLPVIRSMDLCELFAPIGKAVLREALGPEEGVSFDHGMHYFLTDARDLRVAGGPSPLRRLRRDDIPPEQLDLRMSERRNVEGDGFTWAFAWDAEDDIEQAELAPFGPRCASIAIIIWRTPEVAGFGVWTEEAYRGGGRATSAVSAAAAHVLQQGGIAEYDAFADNVPSLRIARRLGFSYGWDAIAA